MSAKHRKISYIKKPFARKSFYSLGFAAVSLCSCVVSVALSVHCQGNGGVNVAAWGLTSLIFAVVSVSYGVSSFLEKEMNYILSRISLAVSGILLVFWVIMMIVGLLL